MMYCQQCGQGIRTSAKFCNKCGTRVKQRFGDGAQAGSGVTPIDSPASVTPPFAPPAKPPVAPPPPPPRLPDAVERNASSVRQDQREHAKKSKFAQNSWPGAEEVTVIPAVALPMVPEPAPTQAAPIEPAPTQELALLRSGQRPADTDELPTQQEIPGPVITGSHKAADTGEINDAFAQRARREQEYKPFFTQVGPAVPNRQHKRVVMVVPLLLLVSILLFLFAYIASK